jgi:hypothetical protein
LASGSFAATQSANGNSASGLEEKFELPPDSSHSASQVTTAHLDG